MSRYLAISFLVVCLDQVSKIYIKLTYLLYESHNILGSFLKFTYIENPGIVFGGRVSDEIYYIITILSVCISCYILFLIDAIYREKRNNYLALVSFSLILGGAIGNIIDRFLKIFSLFNYSGVIDFIDIGVNSFRFYIFNIADMSVTIGILLFIYYNLVEDSRLNDNEEKI